MILFTLSALAAAALEASRDPSRGRRWVVSLFDRTGNWAKPYWRQGHPVLLVDTAHPPGLHEKAPGLFVLGMDVRDLKAQDLPDTAVLLAAPPCRVFCKPGARLWSDWDRSGETLSELENILAVLRLVDELKPPTWAIENPPGRLTTSLSDKHTLGPPRHRFQPWQYGDPWTKHTYLWGRFNAPKPTQLTPPADLVVDRTSRIHSADPRRSATPPGFAEAFEQANRLPQLDERPWVFTHVPVRPVPEGQPIPARPLHGGAARGSETRELQGDLRQAGFAPDAPVVWLSPEPVSKTASQLIQIRARRLDPEQLLPTFQSGGYVLHVGDVPADAVWRWS